MLPNLTCRSCLHTNPSHLLHGQCKLLKEQFKRIVKNPNDGCLGGCICCQSCIGLEESSSLEKVLVVPEVEGSEATGIHFHNGRGVLWILALVLLLLLQVCGVDAIQRRILVAFTSEIVKPVAEWLAMRYSNRVSSYDRGTKFGTHTPDLEWRPNCIVCAS